MNKKLKSYKDYAGKYDISTVKSIRGGRYTAPKSVNELLNEIYEYEIKHKPKDGLYPFLYIK